jgi:hypothetical protein|tara:strand:+ start:140 stop:445 length:306 start_codon:yes stop_codon:yes gene_type:complete
MPIRILEITPSSKAYKRFRIKISEGDKIKHFDFGLDSGQTYIDHQDKNKRVNYWKRHYANKSEKQLIDNLIPSPALFSARLLWGLYPTLQDNVKDLQKDFK